jgi:hypothetical protein
MQFQSSHAQPADRLFSPRRWGGQDQKTKAGCKQPGSTPTNPGSCACEAANQASIMGALKNHFSDAVIFNQGSQKHE